MRCVIRVVACRATKGSIALFLLFSAFVTTAPKAMAAKGDFDIRRIDFGYRMRSGSESVSGGFTGLGAIGGFPQKWGVITAHFNSRPDWADDVMFKYYVMIRPKSGRPAMFTGHVTYVSVAAGLDHNAFMFVHPNSLARYGQVRRITIEIWYQGILASSKQWPTKTSKRWWTQIPAIQGALRPRFFTPFEHDYEVREEDLKLVLPEG